MDFSARRELLLQRLKNLFFHRTSKNAANAHSKHIVQTYDAWKYVPDLTKSILSSIVSSHCSRVSALKAIIPVRLRGITIRLSICTNWKITI